MGDIATVFYKNLWSKRHNSNRKLQKMPKKVKRRVSGISYKALNTPITLEETRKTIKKMLTNKSPGIDGMPAELYQRFDYIADWLYRVFNVLIDRKRLTDTMQTSIVKLLHKKNDRREIGNYRPPITTMCRLQGPGKTDDRTHQTSLDTSDRK